LGGWTIRTTKSTAFASLFGAVADLTLGVPAFAREDPQSLTVGGSGTFSGNHLETLRMEQLAEADVT